MMWLSGLSFIDVSSAAIVEYSKTVLCVCRGGSVFVRGEDAVMTECGGWRKSRDRQVCTS